MEEIFKVVFGGFIIVALAVLLSLYSEYLGVNK